VASRPGFGRATQSCATTLVDGLRCRIEECGYTLEADLPAALGGTGTAPTPSALVRAAIGSCLAMGYRLRAARHGVDVRSIRVIVETDSVIAGMLSTEGTDAAGFGGIRYHVEITSDAPHEQVRAIVDEADRLSPVLDVVSRASRPIRSLAIVGRDG
jgi:uncharacterized OsmC-like protein